MVNKMGWTDKKDMNTEKLPIMTYEERREKIRQQVKDRLAQEKAFLCCSIAGNPKTGKSGTALDCRTDEEKKKGMRIRVLDLDDGCTPTWHTAWNKDENIEIYVPIEYKKDGSTDWIETFENCHAWLDETKEKIAEGNIKAVVLDGVDKVNEGSSDALREHLVKDAKRTGQIVHETDSLKVKALDWRIRNKIKNGELDDLQHAVMVDEIEDFIKQRQKINAIKHYRYTMDKVFKEKVGLRDAKTFVGNKIGSIGNTITNTIKKTFTSIKPFTSPIN